MLLPPRVLGWCSPPVKAFKATDYTRPLHFDPNNHPVMASKSTWELCIIATAYGLCSTSKIRLSMIILVLLSFPLEPNINIYTGGFFFI